MNWRKNGITNDSSKTNATAFVPTVYAQDRIEVVGSTTFPLFGGIDLEFIKMLLAFGALVALPAIPDLVVRAIGKASQAGQSTFTGIFGERTFYRNSAGGFDTVVQKPGIVHLPRKSGWGQKSE